ncbi:3-oxoacyl-[acyl-carrier protein] reductase [Chitinophaga skermanii]|uniref:3-oxoacyl-[acyl-carrier protein] reductase n=1 Tax=Chitinophaga skermanii TaxID=331697 RepID=A0A327R942_9BACT|nr:SDR family oxidoreductase [Chitinophaga skermanii]RAJ10437.1 3-oxoacyl-[acyl-carrier protein] reductase [Chitinophaga skermanii]
MNLSLTGKTALVCGGSQGLGLASAQELALLGASCILISRNADKLAQALQTLDTTQQQTHRYYAVDFSKTADVKAIIDTITASTIIHILINNTGGPAAGPIATAEPGAFLQAFEMHVVNNQILSQAVIPGMKAAGFGRIIQIISTSVKTPIKNLGVSNTIRAAVASWAKTLATELAPFNITVNNVLPGSTTTERLSSLFETQAKARNVSTEVIAEEWKNEIPMQRFGEPREFGAAVAFLASPAASYITGINLPVDGGKTPSL